MLRRNHVLNQIIAAGLGDFESALDLVYLARGQTVCRAGETVDWVYFPVTAVLSSGTIMENGQSIESIRIGNESAVGIVQALGGNAIKRPVTTANAGQAYRITSSRLRKRAEDARYMAVIFDHFRDEFDRSGQLVACAKLHSASARMARTLLSTQDQTGTSSFSYPQDSMALALGVQRTTVTAIAGRLKDHGLIQYSRGVLWIVDRPKLETEACECYGLVRWGGVSGLDFSLRRSG